MTFLSKSSLSASAVLRWLPLFALCAVAAHYFWIVHVGAINIPHQDDIYDFLYIVQLIESADNAQDVVRVWFEQYNDHRTSATRALVYLTYLVEGEVNFRTLTLLANLALPLILCLFYLVVRHEKNCWLILLVSALFLLHMRTYSIVLWGQPAFAYHYVYLYAFACLFALHRVTVPKFLLAAAFSILASLTYAAGQIVWLLGLASLLHQYLVLRQRSPLYPVAWLLLALLMLLLWRAGFVAGSLPEVSADEVSAVRAIFPGLLVDPTLAQILERYIAWFLVILGSAFTVSSTVVAGLCGLFMLVFLSLLSLRSYRGTDVRLILCCWYAVAAAAAVAAGRAMLQTPDYALISRYSFLSVMLLTTLAVLVQIKFKVFRGFAIYILVLLAGAYALWANHNFEQPMQDYMNKRYYLFNQGRYPVFGRSSAESSAIVSEAIATKMYNPPCRPVPECLASTPQG